MGVNASVANEKERSRSKKLSEAPNEPLFEVDDNVDIFAKEMLIHTPRDEALASILGDKSGQETFLRFLQTEFSEEYLAFYHAVEDLKTKDANEVGDYARMLSTAYLQPDSDTDVMVSDALRARITDACDEKGGDLDASEMVKVFEETQKETTKMIALSVIPRFLKSTAFKEWRHSQISDAKDVAAVKNARAHIQAKGIEEESKIVGKNKTSGKVPADLHDIKMGAKWLETFLQSVEMLSTCVSLSSAGEHGFPLIYVNKSFEKMTGYSRSEIIGQNCRFLQFGKQPGHVAEEESVNRLREALRNKVQVKVAITNFRKDGVPFRNFLAMKPIFDMEGNYAFVLGMQFDIGDDDANPAKVSMIENLFKVLPDSIVGGIDDGVTGKNKRK